MSKSLLSLFLIAPFCSFSQLYIGGSEPDILVNQVLPGASAQQISNIEFTGHDHAICYFQANLINMPFTSGMLMTTGTIWDVDRNGPHGPNDKSGSGFNNGFSGFTPLGDLRGNTSYNAAVLEFDIVPGGDSLKFRFIFGSDEYTEYAGGDFADAFACFISGPGLQGNVNIARAMNGAAVSISTINSGNGTEPCMNCNQYIYNGNGSSLPYAASDQYLQYDGLTVPITARTAVIPGGTYHVIFAISDIGDGIIDSGVFIEAGSMTASAEEQAPEDQATVFPNPVTDELTIQLAEGSAITSYEITDVWGQVLKTGSISGAAVCTMGELASGIYFMRFLAPSEAITKKIRKL